MSQLPNELSEFLFENGELFFVDLSPQKGQISIEVRASPELRKLKQKELEMAFSFGFEKKVNLMFRVSPSDD